MLRFEKVILDEQLQVPAIKNRLLKMQTSPEWRRNMFGEYTGKPISAPDDGWSQELFVVFNMANPIGIVNPQLERFHRQVTSLRPCLFIEERKKGYGTEIMRLAFETYKEQGFNRIEARVFGYNEASLRLCRKLFKEEHRKESAVMVDGEFCDIHHFGILCRDIEF